MITTKEYKRAWERRVGPRSAHLDTNNFTKEDLKKLFDQYQMIVDNYNLDNKTIIDLGCGGGLFGLYLFRGEINIKKYIGIDIAKRSIIEAKLNNICWTEANKTKFILIDPIKMTDFNKFKPKPYLIVALNIIQFLPDMQYVKLFFEKINNSEIRNIFIQFRRGDKNIFRKDPYKTTHDIGQANYLTLQKITNLMPNYNLSATKDEEENCYIRFKKTNKKKEKRN